MWWKFGVAFGLVACGSADEGRDSLMGSASPYGAGGAASGVGGAAAVGPGGAAGAAATASGGNPFPASSDFAAPGTFTPTSAPLGSTCTVFRPSTLGEGGRLHPVIVWGNGTFNTPANYTDLFNHFASHGFIVSAANTSNSGSGTEMIQCLEAILAENTSAGSLFQGKVDVGHIASSGYSQGGAGCLMAGKDPRFLVTLPVAPFIALPLGGYDPAAVAAQTHPMFMISGGADTVATPPANQQPIFDGAKVPIVWGTYAPATHFEVLGNGNAYRGPMTAWLRYKLMGDATAGAYFEDPPCSLCTTQNWSVKHNSLWQ